MIKQLWLLSLLSSFTVASGLCAAQEKSAAEKVYRDVSSSVYTVFDVKSNDHQHAIDYGSGVAVTNDVIATNCHVALKGDERIIKVHKILLVTKLVYQNKADDLCLLKISSKNLKPVKLRAANTVHIGEEVFTLGSPKGLEKSIARGIVSNKIPYKNSALLQTDAAISPGSSGGGLFDTDSNLIGITFSKDEGSGTEGIGFALPTEVLSHALRIIHPS